LSDRIYNVLFLCTGNSARSILAESILNLPLVGQGRFRAYSAGSHPAGTVNPYAIELLKRNRIPTDHLRSKSWDEFAGPAAPPLDFVFTVCDNAAGEVCPVWPGQPMTAHWGIADPAAATGNDEEKRKAFFTAYSQLHRRISLFASLPFAKLKGISLQKELDSIGHRGEQPDLAKQDAIAAVRKTVLVLCTGNSCRSQMAEVILNYALGDKVRALSAGTRPQPKVADGAIEALKRAGLPTDGLYPKDVDVVMNETIDLVVTVCDNAKESCPVLPKPVARIHLPFHDPHGEPLASFIAVRDDIRARLLPAVREALNIR
jgi:protein-tyrosine-phosphatase